jgi:diacylglycerol O-acyltransferase
MDRLSGLDAFFLYVETPSMHTHVALTAVLDPSTTPGGYTFQRFRDHIAARANELPLFHRRVAAVPLRLHHPVWVDDERFRPEDHIHRAALPSPGGQAELADLVGYLAGIPLERDRPLWEMWVIEGLAEGRIALLAKIHHAAVDGVGAAELMPTFFDLEPDPPARPTPLVRPEAAPGRWELLGMAGAERVRAIGRLPGLARRTGEAIGSIRHRRRTDGAAGGTPLGAPRTVFNGTITAERSVAFARLSLSEVKEVKAAFGATVNDVLLATCALTVRRYLEARGGAPDEPLVTACPVSVAPAVGAAPAAGRNKLSVMFTLLQTQQDDPAAVLEATCAAAAAAKREHAIVGDDILAGWAEVADPTASAIVSRLYHRVGASGRHRPAISFILSNIPGPAFPVYLAGARMERAYPFGPVLDGAGLNVSVLSHEDHVDLGFMGASAVVPDVWELADAVAPALADLLAAARGRRAPLVAT